MKFYVSALVGVIIKVKTVQFELLRDSLVKHTINESLQRKIVVLIPLRNFVFYYNLYDCANFNGIFKLTTCHNECSG